MVNFVVIFKNCKIGVVVNIDPMIMIVVTKRHKDEKSKRQKDEKAKRQKDKKSKRQKDKQTNRQKEKKAKRQKDKNTKKYLLAFYYQIHKNSI